MRNLKKYFKFIFWLKPAADQQAVGAVVYRIKGGQIEIFLSRKRRRWQLPYIVLAAVHSTSSAEDLLRAELVNNYGLKQLKVWQSLGSFLWRARRRNLQLHILLIQFSQSKADSDERAEKMAWQSVNETVNNLSSDIMKQAVILAVSKIKRARI